MLTWIDKGSSRNIFINMFFVFSLNNIEHIKSFYDLKPPGLLFLAFEW